MSRKKQCSPHLAEARRELEISGPDVSMTSARLLIVGNGTFASKIVLDVRLSLQIHYIFFYNISDDNGGAG